MHRRSLFLALVMLLLVSLPATADVMGHFETWTFGDSSTIYPGWGNGHEDTKDVIGIPDLLGGNAVVENIGGSYFLRSVTLFLTAATNPGPYALLDSGDLLIDTDGDDVWDNAVALLGASAGTVDVYDLSLAYDAATGYVMSSMPGYDIRDDHPIAVDYDGLGLSPSDSADFSGLPGWPGPGVIASLTIGGLSIALDSSLTLGYTVSCANDVLFETMSATPIPASLLLLGLGLMGLMGVRRLTA